MAAVLGAWAEMVARHWSNNTKPRINIRISFFDQSKPDNHDIPAPILPVSAFTRVVRISDIVVKRRNSWRSCFPSRCWGPGGVVVVSASGWEKEEVSTVSSTKRVRQVTRNRVQCRNPGGEARQGRNHGRRAERAIQTGPWGWGAESKHSYARRTKGERSLCALSVEAAAMSFQRTSVMQKY